MDPKTLTESSWKAFVAKNKIKDNGLQRALNVLDKVDEKDHEGKLKALGQVTNFASVLKKSKEVADNSTVTKYLGEMIGDAEAMKKQVSAESAKAEKAEKASQKEGAKGGGGKGEDEDDDKDKGKEDEDEEEDADYSTKLLKGLMKVRAGNGKPFPLLLCVARPPAIMIANQITGKHKEQLAKETGSKHFHAIGTCRFEHGAFVLNTGQPEPGMARKIQLAVKDVTGKKFKFIFGGETAGDEEEGEEKQGEEEGVAQAKQGGGGAGGGAASTGGAGQGESQAGGGGASTGGTATAEAGGAGEAGAAQSGGTGGAASPPKPALAKAPQEWHSTIKGIEAKIEELKKAVVKQYEQSKPQLVAEIEKNLGKLDAVLDKLDTKLSDSLSKAAAAKSDAERKTELVSSKAILVDYIKYVKTEPLIAHMDANPFGVKTNIKQTLTESLTKMAQAIS